jgi:integrase
MACRFDELIQLTWADCQTAGKEIVGLRIKGKGRVFHDVGSPGRLCAALLEWKGIQESFKARRIMVPGGSPSWGWSLCLQDTLESHSQTERSIYGCGPLAERLG